MVRLLRSLVALAFVLGLLSFQALGNAQVSPDLQGEVAYVLDGDLVLHNLTNSSTTQLTDAGQAMLPAWSPDGRFLTYSSGLDLESSNLYILDISTGESRLLAEDACCADWTPNGERIAFLAVGEDDLSLSLISSDGTEQVILLSPLTENGPALLPNGKLVWWNEENAAGILAPVRVMDPTSDNLGAVRSILWIELGLDDRPMGHAELLEGSTIGCQYFAIEIHLSTESHADSYAGPACTDEGLPFQRGLFIRSYSDSYTTAIHDTDLPWLSNASYSPEGVQLAAERYLESDNPLDASLWGVVIYDHVTNSHIELAANASQPVWRPQPSGSPQADDRTILRNIARSDHELRPWHPSCISQVLLTVDDLSTDFAQAVRNAAETWNEVDSKLNIVVETVISDEQRKYTPTDFEGNTIDWFPLAQCELRVVRASDMPDRALASVRDSRGEQIVTDLAGWVQNYHDDAEEESLIASLLILNDLSANWSTRNFSLTPVKFDVETIALHEIGHALGLKHSSNSSSVMAGEGLDHFLQWLGFKRRELLVSDRSALLDLYGRHAETTTVSTVIPIRSSTPTPTPTHRPTFTSTATAVATPTPVPALDARSAYPLTGRWELSSAGGDCFGSYEPTIIEFFDEGLFSTRVAAMEGLLGGRYIVLEDGRLRLELQQMNGGSVLTTCNLLLEVDTLTLTGPFSMRSQYVRPLEVPVEEFPLSIGGKWQRLSNASSSCFTGFGGNREAPETLRFYSPENLFEAEGTYGFYGRYTIDDASLTWQVPQVLPEPIPTSSASAADEMKALPLALFDLMESFNEEGAIEWKPVEGSATCRIYRMTQNQLILGDGIASSAVYRRTLSSAGIDEQTQYTRRARALMWFDTAQNMDANGDWYTGFLFYRRALTFDPGNDLYMLHAGRMLVEMAKRALAPLGTESKLYDMTDILTLSPEAISAMGQTELLQVAEVVLLEAQRVAPSNVDHTANLARYYRISADLAKTQTEKQFNLEQSLQYYQDAVAMRPTLVIIWNEMATILSLLGRKLEAEEVLHHSLTLSKTTEATYIQLAQLLDEQGHTEDLIELLEKGLEEVPNSSALRAFLGSSQAHSGQIDGMLNTYLEILKQDPQNAVAAQTLAIIYRDLGKIEEAIYWAEYALDLGQAQQLDESVLNTLQLLLDELRTGQ